MAHTEQARVLLLDAAPGDLLDRELERLLGHGPTVELSELTVGILGLGRTGLSLAAPTAYPW